MIHTWDTVLILTTNCLWWKRGLTHRGVVLNWMYSESDNGLYESVMRAGTDMPDPSTAFYITVLFPGTGELSSNVAVHLDYSVCSTL